MAPFVQGGNKKQVYHWDYLFLFLMTHFIIMKVKNQIILMMSFFQCYQYTNMVIQFCSSELRRICKRKRSKNRGTHFTVKIHSV